MKALKPSPKVLPAKPASSSKPRITREMAEAQVKAGQRQFRDWLREPKSVES